MSRRRWAMGLGPPIARVGGVTLLAAAVVGCAGVRPTASPGAPTASGSPVPAPGSAAPAESDLPLNLPLGARDLIGMTWLAEGPKGWEAGQVGGRRVTLGDGEVGIAVGGPWIVSAVLRPTDSIQLLIREGAAGDPRVIQLGSLAPTATVIVGDRAYVSGFSFGTPTDPGILEIGLKLGTIRTVLPAAASVGSRYLAASPDGATLVSSLCDLASDPEPESCRMTMVSLRDGTVRDLGAAPGGLLRATSSEVAVVAPHGPEAPDWIAGIDLATGRELWRVAGGEFGPSVTNARHGLIQQRLVPGPQPRLAIEAVDLRSGKTTALYEESGSGLGSLWPALCSPVHIALGPDATGSRALGAGPDARARVKLVPLDGRDPLDVLISLRSEP